MVLVVARPVQCAEGEAHLLLRGFPVVGDAHGPEILHHKRILGGEECREEEYGVECSSFHGMRFGGRPTSKNKIINKANA